MVKIWETFKAMWVLKLLIKSVEEHTNPSNPWASNWKFIVALLDYAEIP